MKKILIISSLYPHPQEPVRGIFVQKQAQELARKYRVKVFLTRAGTNSYYPDYEHDNIQVYCNTYKFPFTIISPWYYYKAVKKKLLNLIKEYQPDIIHVHDYKHYPELFILNHILDFKKYKVILTLHNLKLFINNSLKTRPFYAFMLKYSLSHFFTITVVGNKVKKLLQQNMQYKNKIHVIGNGVETEYQKYSKEQLTEYLPKDNNCYNIISVGNLMKTKGFDLLIKAVDIISREQNISLSIAGDGPYRHKLEELLQNVKNDNIRLLGKVDHDKVMNLYQYYDGFVLASYSETFGIVYLEAMLHHIPALGIIGEGIDGVIIDGENGFLAKPQSLEHLTSKIREMINSDNIKAITNNAFDTVKQHYLLPSVMKKYESLY